MNIISDDKFPKTEYEKLLKYTEGNLDDLTNEEGFVIPSSLNKVFMKFLEEILLLSRESNIDFIEDLKKIENQSRFWEAFDGFIKQNNIPYEETVEIRKLTYDSYVNSVDDIFDKHIIYNNDDVKKNKWLKEPDVVVLIKLINFCIDAIIVKRFNNKKFKHFVEIMFGLENKKIEYMWNVIQKNKSILQINYVISKLDELSYLLGDNE